MAKLLYIKANPKLPENSNTFQLANAFLNEYKKLNPDDEVDFIDLYEDKNIRFLDHDMLEDMANRKDNIMMEYAKKFAEYDKYVIAAPMWNLGSPAILKAYFDYISYVGVTFKYTAEGPIGLLSDRPRKAMHIVSRGGYYSDGPASKLEFGDKYVRAILNFYGVHNVETLSLELTNVLTGEDLTNAREAAYMNAREAAKSF
jgi:FMN-dependent NADH-azoreductase